MPVSISDSLCHIAGRVIVEVVEYLILLVDGVEETAQELDSLPLILEEFDDLAVIVEVWRQDEAGEVGRRLEADVRLEADEIREELVDLGNPITSIEHDEIDRALRRRVQVNNLLCDYLISSNPITYRP